jgi:uncharacterized protein (DUF488 family)
VLYTIGHSTRTLAGFVSLLKAHGVRRLVDVRSFPGSRRYPHFNREALEKSLPEAGVEYVWMGDSLGGRRRKSREGGPHSALRNASFKNYADYMDTPAFHDGIVRLLELAGEKPTAFMCSEAVWWRCHRGMISDFLLARGREVLHIMSETKADSHRLHSAARLGPRGPVYDVVARPSRSRDARSTKPRI